MIGSISIISYYNMKYGDFPNIEGRRFGKIVVIEMLSDRKCRVKCDCGVIKDVNKYDVYKNKIKSCGKTECSSKLKNISGQKINYLTVLEIVPNEKELKTRSSIWKCQCDCGVIFTVPSYMIHTNRTKSCGCKKGEMIANKIAHPLEFGIWNSLFLSYKNGAKSRQISFSLSKEEFLGFLKQNCFYCGIEPSKVLRRTRSHGQIEVIYNGIDRKDNTLGYSIVNCVTCCKTCNIAKNNMKYEEFYNWIKRLSENLFNKNNCADQVDYVNHDDFDYGWSGKDF